MPIVPVPVAVGTVAPVFVNDQLGAGVLAATAAEGGVAAVDGASVRCP